MFRKILIMWFCCTATGAAAASLNVCATLATGDWIIVSTRPYSKITALSFDEAHAYVGKKVSISDGKVNYAGKTCDVTGKNVIYSVGEGGDDPKFPYAVLYDCRDDIFIPGFSVGKSCNRISTGEDGWNFYLRRVKTK